MTQPPMSKVQFSNLSLLITIREAILTDHADACCQFGLSAQQAERLTAINIQKVFAVVVNLGETTLFPPRQDLLELLEAPLPLLRPLAAVHGPQVKEG